MSYWCQNCRKVLPRDDWAHTCFDALAEAKEAERLAARDLRTGLGWCYGGGGDFRSSGMVQFVEAYDAACDRVDELSKERK